MSVAISLILPVYNVASYISACVGSIIKQSFRNFELIVVDDCGTDDSMNLLRHQIDNTPSFEVPVYYVQHTHNRGLSAARNTGLDLAQGKYIFFVDSDDCLLPDCLQTLYRQAEQHEAQVVVGNHRIMGEAKWVPGLGYSQTTVVEGQPSILDGYISGKICMMAWNKLLRREFLLRYHLTFVEGLIHEDNPWFFRLVCYAEKLVVDITDTYVYRVRPDSLQTGKDFSKHFDAYCDILQLIADVVKEPMLPFDVLHYASFRSWYERTKALYFGMTIEQGSKTQQRQLYRLIRQLLPVRKATKSCLHYSLPIPLGYPMYRRFFGRLLC